MKTELSDDMKAYREQVNAEWKAKYAAALAAMTPEKAVSILQAAREVLSENDYLAGASQLRIVADWIKQKQAQSEESTR